MWTLLISATNKTRPNIELRGFCAQVHFRLHSVGIASTQTFGGFSRSAGGGVLRDRVSPQVSVLLTFLGDALNPLSWL